MYCIFSILIYFVTLCNGPWPPYYKIVPRPMPTPFFHRLMESWDSVRSLIIRFQIGNTLLRCGETGEKVGKSHEIWALWPSTNFFGSPQSFKTSFEYSFSGPIARKSLDYARWPWVTMLGGGFGARKFQWGSPPKFWTNFLKKITPISDLLSYKGCLLVERPRRFGGKRKKEETSVVK